MSTHDVDEYLAGFEEPKRAALEHLRRSIAALIPDAEQGLSYGVPVFRIAGKPIAGLGGRARHNDATGRGRSTFLQDRRRRGIRTYMTPTHVLHRRPLIGMVAGLLLVSACGTAAESTPIPTTPASTTPASTTPASTTPASDIVVDGAPDTTQAAPASTGRDETVASTTALPPTTSPPATVPPADPAPLDAVDVSGRTVFGVSVFDAVDVDAIAGDVSARLGSPTTDSGWQPTVGQSCAGSTDFRVLWWGDFRMTFERYQGDGAVRDELSAWTVGDPTLFELAPIGDVPAPSPSGIVTLEGIGLGSTRADVGAAWANINDGGDGLLVVIDRGGSLAIGLDDDEQVVGLGDGPFDCPVDELR